jgi:putative addiction module component (TIGR02574 family)
MSLETRKLEVMQQLLLVDSEEVLDRVHDMLNAENTFALSDAQKAELDARKLRYERGESRTYTLEETKSRVRASLRK